MSVEFDKEFMTLHDKLDKNEAIIFCLFLKSEYKRHLDDAHIIIMRIAQMEKKHGFNTNDEYDKLKFVVNSKLCENYKILHESV